MAQFARNGEKSYIEKTCTNQRVALLPDNVYEVLVAPQLYRGVRQNGQNSLQEHRDGHLGLTRPETTCHVDNNMLTKKPITDGK